MHDIMIITNDKERFASLAQGFQSKPGFVIRRQDSFKESSDKLSKLSPALLIVDEEVDGISNFQIARQIITKNPMINLALVSGLSAHDFHETGEGLGILAQLPPHPGEEDALRLIALLEKILSPQPAK
jgi:DNA-binding response OmpR family regulator